MIWWVSTISILVLIGFFVVIPIILRLLGSGFVFIFKFILTLIELIILVALVIFCADTFFDAGWWDIITNWFQHITM